MALSNSCFFCLLLSCNYKHQYIYSHQKVQQRSQSAQLSHGMVMDILMASLITILIHARVLNARYVALSLRGEVKRRRRRYAVCWDVISRSVKSSIKSYAMVNNIGCECSNILWLGVVSALSA